MQPTLLNASLEVNPYRPVTFPELVRSNDSLFDKQWKAMGFTDQDL